VQFSTKRDAPFLAPVEAVVIGLGMRVVELAVSHHHGSVQARIIVYKKEGIGVNDCSKVHRSIQARFELTFPGQDIYIEVASPGVERNIKDASEFPVFIGRGVTCYRTDISDWTSGIIADADENRVILRARAGLVELPYGNIAKAKLDYSQEVEH